MECREVEDRMGNVFQLTENEEKFLRALERLSKMNPGRLYLLANGIIDVRIINGWAENSIQSNVNILCEGGDGGDYSENFDWSKHK